MRNRGRRKKEGGENAKKASAGSKSAKAPEKVSPAKSLSPASERREALPSLHGEKGDLPGSYGESRIVLLALGPHLAHVYWNLREEDLTDRKRKKRRGKAGPVLRFFDVTEGASGGQPPEGSLDVPVEIEAGNWYVDLMSPERSFFVELGFRDSRGSFSAVARSNVAEFPPAQPSQARDERYMLVKGNYRMVRIVSRPAAGTRKGTGKAQAPFAGKGKDAQPDSRGRSGLAGRDEEGFTPGVSSR